MKHRLEREGVETRTIFSFIPNQLAYSYLKPEYKGMLSTAEYIYNHGFYIGCHQYLEDEDLEQIYTIFKNVLKSLVK